MTTALPSRVISKGTVVPAATTTTVYTCPANFTAKVVLFFAANAGNSNKTIQIEWYDNSASTAYHIVNGYVVAGYSFLKFDQSYLVLNAGDYMRVTTEAASNFDVTVTAEEFFDPAQNGG